MAITVYNWTKESEGDYDSFESWVTGQGSTERSVSLGTNVSLTGNLNIPYNIDLVNFYNGAKFTGSTNLIINRMSARPKHQIFDDGLNVLFNSGAITLFQPEWFGSGNCNIMVGSGMSVPLSKLYVQGGIAVGTNHITENGDIYIGGRTSGVAEGVFGSLFIPGTGTFNNHLYVNGNIYVRANDTIDGFDVSSLNIGSGYIPWAGSTTVYNPSPIYTNAGKIGINTTDISARLHVKGSGRFDGIVSANNPVLSGDLATKYYVDNSIAGVSGSVGAGTSGYIPKYISSSGLGNSRIYENQVNTRIGFGTTEPTLPFDFSGSIGIKTATSPGLYFGANNYFPSSGSINYNGNTGSVNINSDINNSQSDSKILFNVDGFTNMIIYGSDWERRIGIGQAIPTAKLHVGGSGCFDGVIWANNPTETGHLATKYYVDTTSGNLNTYITNTSGQLNTRINNSGIYAINTSGQLNTYITNTSGQLNTYITNTSGQLNTYITNVSGQLNNRITNISGSVGPGTSGYISKFTSTSGIGNSQIYDNGTNIGIGTTSPFQKLQVSDGNISIDNTKAIYFCGSSGPPADENWRIGRNTGWVGKALVTDNSLDILAGPGTGEGIVFGRNNGTSALEIDTNDYAAYFRGNVGINMTGPLSGILNIKPEIPYESYGVARPPLLMFHADRMDNGLTSFPTGCVGSISTHYISYGAGSEMCGGGLVINGIGNMNSCCPDIPEPGLTFNAYCAIEDPANSYPIMKFNVARRSGTDLAALGNDETAYQFNNNGTEIFKLDGHGNTIFKGTSHYFGAVDGYTYIANATINFQYSENAEALGYINYWGYNGGGTQFRDLVIGNGKGVRVLYVDGSTGCVGIGTDSPGSKLSVVGLPTSASGLSSGDIWVDTSAGNVLKIV